MTPPMIQRGAAMGEAPPAPPTAGGWVRSGWLKTAGLAVIACAMTGASLSAARGAQGWFGAALALLMLAIAVIDARSLLIPNRLSLAAFLLGLAAAGLGASPEFWRDFWQEFWLPAAQAIGFAVIRAAVLGFRLSRLARALFSPSGPRRNRARGRQARRGRRRLARLAHDAGRGRDRGARGAMRLCVRPVGGTAPL